MAEIINKVPRKYMEIDRYEAAKLIEELSEFMLIHNMASIVGVEDPDRCFDIALYSPVEYVRAVGKLVKEGKRGRYRYIALDITGADNKAFRRALRELRPFVSTYLRVYAGVHIYYSSTKLPRWAEKESDIVIRLVC